MGVDAPMIYLDSCIVIYLVEEHAEFSEKVRSAIRTVPNARFCISPLVEMECLVGPLKLGDVTLQTEYQEFFAQLFRIGIPDEVYHTAANLRAIHAIKTPDALHLAVAQYHGCTQLWTNDDRLAKAAPNLAANALTA